MGMLNPGTLPPSTGPAGSGLTGAAVLVPLVDHPSGLTVLLTQRTAHLTDHAGQISFPGGRIEDVSATQAEALRLGARLLEKPINPRELRTIVRALRPETAPA